MVQVCRIALRPHGFAQDWRHVYVGYLRCQVDSDLMANSPIFASRVLWECYISDRVITMFTFTFGMPNTNHDDSRRDTAGHGGSRRDTAVHDERG